ncbi:MAG: polysaccharide biosynthesis/export family protein [Allopontixanthobacter sp.]|nr:polysaccharide biosynthesis/export family protein [Allopontixanthobacter sp.]
MKRILVVTVLSLSCAACGVKSPLPTGQAAYAIIPPLDAPRTVESYQIGPLDTVNVTVFQEPDLSVEEVKIDPSGRLPLPLLGSVNATGKTADELASDIRQRLATYLVNPNVSVTVNSITQRVIVEGSVKQPGVYDIRGNSSLIEALAMAQSPTNVADLDQVFVFRQINGQTHGARFDLQRIRAGIDADPAIIAGDRVVVGLNEVAAAWQDYLAAPVFNVFRVL